jgi:hypothetical protein
MAGVGLVPLVFRTDSGWLVRFTAALNVAGGTGRFMGVVGQGVLYGTGTFEKKKPSEQKPSPPTIEGKSPSLPLIDGHPFDLRLAYLLTLTDQNQASEPVGTAEGASAAAQ